MPNDIVRCSYCSEKEHIHLLDGVITASGQDTGKLACIACYPRASAQAQAAIPAEDRSTWALMSANHISLSVNPRLKPFYEEWQEREDAR